MASLLSFLFIGLSTPALSSPPVGGAPAGPAVVPDPSPWLDAVVLLTTGGSICAGALIDDEGTVLTAYHCVASGRRPLVETRAGASGVGEVLAARPRDDLAVLRVPALAGQPTLALRDVDPVVGERVWALGHPHGGSGGALFQGLLRWSVSSGIVSAVGERLTQVDAPMNPGNSGGPLVDADGAIVGIASRKLRADNIAFISEASRARSLLEGLEEEPEAVEPRLLLGGQIVPVLTWSVPFEFDTATALGAGAELWLRDRVGFAGTVHAPLRADWLALQRGTVRWSAGEARAAARAHVGRGSASTTFDLGGGVMLVGAREGSIEDGVLRLSSVSVFPEVQPMIWGRVALAGLGMRWSVMPDARAGFSEPEVWMSVDLIPGTLTVF